MSEPVEFDCVDCENHIYAFGITEVPADRRCGVCHELAVTIADPVERARVRRLLYPDTADL